MSQLMSVSPGKFPAFINIIIANFNWVLIELQAVYLPFTYIISLNAPHMPFSTDEGTSGWECTVTCSSCPVVKCGVGFKHRSGWLAFEPKFWIALLCSWDGPSSRWAPWSSVPSCYHPCSCKWPFPAGAKQTPSGMKTPAQVNALSKQVWKEQLSLRTSMVFMF